MNFAERLKAAGMLKETENGGKSCKTTGDSLIDLFGTIGAMRDRADEEIIDKWLDARYDNMELADNLILYTRDITHGGLGERRIGRLLLKKLAQLDPAKVSRNLNKIVAAGRWDDLFVLFDTRVEKYVIDFIRNQLIEDVNRMENNKSISLLAKWLKSPNTSSKESRKMARKIYKSLNLTEKTYRKTLSALRKYLKVTEKQMSSGDWNEIEFEKVPSYAMKNYSEAFKRHTPHKFMSYLDDVKENKSKINASTLYPYDIVKNALDYGVSETDELQWKALPKIPSNDNVLFVVDTSGSMTWNDNKPLATAIGLAIYYAEQNMGEYHNLFMGFDSSSNIYKLRDNWTLAQKIDYIQDIPWGGSTNLDEAFRKIYDIAIDTGDVPAAICIVSDMEINDWESEDNVYSITDKWAKKFTEFDLKLPKLIYWNVEARNDTFLASKDDNVAFVSGYGLGPFRNFQELLHCTAYEAMTKILSKKQFTWS